MDFIQAKGSYRFSSDALLLADFACMYLSKNIFNKKRGIKAPFLFLDLGCGCGVIGIQILKYIKKNYPHYMKDSHILGIDKEPTLVESANANAQAFGFCENYDAICADISAGTSAHIAKEIFAEPGTRGDSGISSGIVTGNNSGIGTSMGTKSDIGAGITENSTTNTPAMGIPVTNILAANISAKINLDTCDKAVQNWALGKMKVYSEKMENASDGVRKNPRLFDAVITNPPWYNKEQGEVSSVPLRRNALFGDERTMSVFLDFAEKRLKKNASLYMVGKSSNFVDCAQFIPASLRCTTMQNVHANRDVAAVFFLLEARFQSKAQMVFPAPIFLDTKFL